MRIDNVIHGVLKEYTCTVHFFNEAAGSFSASESGNVEVFGLGVEYL